MYSPRAKNQTESKRVMNIIRQGSTHSLNGVSLGCNGAETVVISQKMNLEKHTNDDANRNDEGKKSTDNKLFDFSKLEGVFASDFLKPSGREKAEQFMTSLGDMLTSYLMQERDPASKVMDFNQPHQLKEMMSHCLEIHEEPRDLEQVLSDCRETLKYCVRTGHPHFFNQLSTGVDVVGVAGAWLSATANTNMFTYEAAPVFTLMEEVVLTRMRGLVGWADGDGIFAPGGAISNLYAVLTARHRMFPNAKHEGIDMGARPVVFTSEHSHYSMKRAASLLGIGINNCIYVKCHDNGKMILSDLRLRVEECIAEGKKPLLVNCMCGTTVLGAFDPIQDIADLCEEFGIWMHCDAAWGGGILMSREHKHLFDGVERCDSITWNPHKMMGTPLQCSAFLTKHKGVLTDCNSMSADYLFMKDKSYDISYDTGDQTIQCGRHNDIFKLWLMWRAKGDQGFAEQIDRMLSLAAYLRDLVKARDGFHLVLEDFEAPNICFFYLPEAWRVKPIADIRPDLLGRVAPKVKSRMMEAGTITVQYQPLGLLPNMFRVAVSNHVLTPRDMDFILDEMDKLGADIPLPADWE